MSTIKLAELAFYWHTRKNLGLQGFLDVSQNEKSRFRRKSHIQAPFPWEGSFLPFVSELHLNKRYIFQCLLWYLFRTINEFINYSPLILPHLRRGDIFLAILRKLLLPRLLKPPKKSQCGQKYLKLKMSWIFTVSQYGYIILKHLNGFSE